MHSVIFYSARIFIFLREIISSALFFVMLSTIRASYLSFGLHSLSNITFSVQSIFYSILFKSTCTSGIESTAPGSGEDAFSLSAIKAIFIQTHTCIMSSIDSAMLLFLSNTFYFAPILLLLRSHLLSTPVFLCTLVPLPPDRGQDTVLCKPRWRPTLELTEFRFGLRW